MKENKWIAVDFDGVLSKYDGWKGFDKFGKPNKIVIDAINEFYNQGFKIAIFTTRQFTPKMGKWLKKNNVHYDRFNNSIETNGYFMNDKKIFYSAILDDRAVHYNIDNGDTVNDIMKKVYNVVYQYDFD